MLSQDDLIDRVKDANRKDHTARRGYWARILTERFSELAFGWYCWAKWLGGVAQYNEAWVAANKAREVMAPKWLWHVHELMGDLFTHRGEHRKAEAWFRLSTGSTADAQGLISLGNCLAFQERLGEAEISYQQALDADPEHPAKAFCRLGLIFRAEGAYDEALATFGKAAEIDPHCSLAKEALEDVSGLRELLLHESTIRLEKEDELWIRVDAAGDKRPACQACLLRWSDAAHPGEPYIKLHLAKALRDMGLYGSARTAANESLKRLPQDEKYHAYRMCGLVAERQGDAWDAERWHRRALANHRNHLDLIFLGGCLARQGKYEEAKHCHREAVEINPEEAEEAHYNIGLILRAEGRYEKALSSFDKALEIDPQYELAKHDREDVLCLLDEMKSAE